MSAADDRADAILIAARGRTGDELTMLELAESVQRMPGHGFSRDLSHARHRALDCGERITECFWSRERKCFVLVHLNPGQEAGKGALPLLVHGADVTTRAHSLHRHAHWERQNAESVLDREVAKVAEHMTAATVEMGEAYRTIAALAKRARDEDA